MISISKDLSLFEFILVGPFWINQIASRIFQKVTEQPTSIIYNFPLFDQTFPL